MLSLSAAHPVDPNILVVLDIPHSIYE